MRKMWLVVKHDYWKAVRQKGFLLALFSLPLFIALSVGLGYFMRSQEINSDAIGYIDYSGQFERTDSLSGISEDEVVDILHFSEESEAEQMLRSGQLQAYFVIPEGYPLEKDVDMYFLDEPRENAVNDFYDFLQFNLTSDFPVEIRERVATGTSSIIRTPDGSREFPDNNPPVKVFIPLIIGLGFVMLLLISSGYLMSGFLDEKSNRTIELIFTSLSPGQLVGSKLITMVAIGVTMVTTWAIVGILVFFLGKNILALDWMQDMAIEWQDLLTILVVALPSYFFAAALMLAIGLLLGNNQEAESVGPLFFMAGFIPIYFLVPITRELNGPISILLSSLPITSILTVGLRNIFVEIPPWQLILSACIQLLFVAGALWLATATFRIGMLRTGSRIRWNELFPKSRKQANERGQ